MGGEVENVKAWLRSRHISVLDEWIQACVEWIQQQHQGSAVPSKQLCDMVYEQWQDSDLSEITAPCLPPGLGQARKTQLRGHYALQVNSIQDISSPAYAQLTKLQGRENENAMVSAAPPTQSKPEAKPSRVLMLSLTDGQQTLQALEYRPIPALHPHLPPGTKLLLSGDVQCRLGVAMLTSAHVRILGGEVEALREENCQQNILARAIGVNPPGGNNQNAELNPRPAATTTSNTTTSTHVATENSHNTNNDSNSGSTGSNPTHHSNRHPANHRTNQWSGTAWTSDKKPQVKDEAGRGYSGRGGPTGRQERQPVTGGGVADQFELDDDFDDYDALMLEELEAVERQQAQQRRQPAAKVEEDWDDGGINEEELLCMEWEASGAQQQQQQNSNSKSNGQPWQQTQHRLGLQRNTSSETRPNIAQSYGKPSGQVIPKQEPAAARGAPTSKSGSSNGPGGGRLSHRTGVPPPNVRGGVFGANAVPLFKSESRMSNPTTVSRAEAIRPSGGMGNVVGRSVPANRTSNNARACEKGQDGPMNSRVAVATRIVKQEVLSQGHQRFGGENNVDDAQDAITDVAGRQDVKRDFVSAQSLVAYSVESASKRRRTDHDCKARPPFVYLVDMAGCIGSKEACQFDIKGFIMTLVSSLAHSPTWSLRAKINDGTMSLDVDISDQVLSQLIGFTVDEMMQMKASMKKVGKEQAAEIKQSIKTGVSRCQEALIDLSCIMTLEVREEHPRPVVVAVRQPTLDDCRALYQCLKDDE